MLFLKSKKNILLGIVLVLILIAIIIGLRAPSGFPIKSSFSVNDGDALINVSKELKKDKIIRSEVAFQSFSILFASDKHIIAGDYYFEKALPVFEIAWRLVHGKYGYDGIKITIPEGYNVTDIAVVLGKKFSAFDLPSFLTLAKDQEGFLFPDTYTFFPSVKPEKVIDTLHKNFEKKIKGIESEINSSQKSLNDIVTMASIIEREAGVNDDRAIIAGILWKRIKLGIRLQVDADPETYDHGGLPKSPICNPGLPSILAAAEPKDSPYLYYLHDKDGKIHYAKTFEEHKLNKQKYLK